jgi:pentapeptide MXKDX repeat protein
MKLVSVVVLSSVLLQVGAAFADDMAKDGMSKDHMSKSQQQTMKDCMAKQDNSMTKAAAKKACQDQMKKDNMDKDHMSKMGNGGSH